jgi:hypothetical protein
MIPFSLSIPFTYAVIPFYIDVFSDGPSRLISSAVQTAAAGVFIWSRSFALVAAHTMRCAFKHHYSPHLNKNYL